MFIHHTTPIKIDLNKILWQQIVRESTCSDCSMDTLLTHKAHHTKNTLDYCRNISPDSTIFDRFQRETKQRARARENNIKKTISIVCFFAFAAVVGYLVLSLSSSCCCCC